MVAHSAQIAEMRARAEAWLAEPSDLSTLGEFMQGVWLRGGRNVCSRCGRAIYNDRDSGYWIHAGHANVDGGNGLYCSPASWEPGAKANDREYAVPVPRELADSQQLARDVVALTDLLRERGR